MKTCFLFIHKWEKWSKILQGYSGLTQFRRCENCGKMQYRSIYGNQVPSDKINEALFEEEVEE